MSSFIDFSKPKEPLFLMFFDLFILELDLCDDYLEVNMGKGMVFFLIDPKCIYLGFTVKFIFFLVLIFSQF